MPFDFADNVFLLHFAFEAAERAFHRLVITELDLCQFEFTSLSLLAVRFVRPTLRSGLLNEGARILAGLGGVKRSLCLAGLFSAAPRKVKCGLPLSADFINKEYS